MIKLFHIEDDEAHRVLVSRALAGTGADVEITSATTGVDALAELRTFRCDCILSDFHLPDMTALELLEQFKNQQLPIVPMVVMTGRTDQALAVEMLERGAQDYVVKGSVDGELLLRSIRYSIQRHQLSLEIQKTNRQLVEKSRVLEEQKAEILDKANRLESSERYRTDFLRAVSNNLRNPMNSLLSLSEALCDDDNENLDDRQRQYVAAIRDSGKALLSSIEEIELLALSRRAERSDQSTTTRAETGQRRL
ncbi:MAG: response regulator [Verrucomicrobiae bacterium]|nr:response regulator [Verrucomicrobiae bacterium]